ncbi:MAG: hypothetical protein GXP25_08645 [Planctomycetes bacterium]|nr:hypothetical protein [Planctomycetota bacterium]
MKQTILPVLAATVCLSLLTVFAQDKKPYYYKGNHRKMRFHAAPKKLPFSAKTGTAATNVPGVIGAEELDRRYFACGDVTRSRSIRSYSIATGAQMERPMRTFTVGPGTVMVPYVPPDRGHMRVRRKHLNPYYTIESWAPPY